LASAPDSGPTGTLSEGLVLATIAASAAVLALVARVLWLEEALSARTLALMILVAVGTFVVGITAAAISLLLARRWPGWLRAAIAALGVGGGMLPATMFCFAVHIRLIEGHVEAESVTDLSAGDIFWTLFGAMGMFTPTGLTYLVPWPMLATALVTFALFYRWPPRRTPEPTP
jgi:hypothetical protein